MKAGAISVYSRNKLLLVALSVSAGLGVFAVQALGSFGPARHFHAGASPAGIAVGKLNRDSHPDLAVVSSGNNVVVLLGNGAGGFGRPKRFATGRIPDAVAIGDLNVDGKPDLAVANHSSNNVSILLGHGDGTFGKARNSAAGNVPTSIAIGKFNGDNRPDLAVANDLGHNGNSVSILLGHGDGTFGPPTNYPVGGIFPTSIAIGKFNGDLNPDLAVAVRTSDSVSVLLGHGDGTFGTAKNFAAGDGATSIATGRLNGDSRLDLATANYNANSVAVLLGRGDGTFGKPKSFAVGTHPTSVAIGNLNGDSHPDLAVANQNSDTVSVLPRTRQRHLRQGDRLSAPPEARKSPGGRDRQFQRRFQTRPGRRHRGLQGRLDTAQHGPEPLTLSYPKVAPPLADTFRFMAQHAGASRYQFGTGRIVRFVPCVPSRGRMDAWDASGRIWQPCPPTGGRAVAGSNPASPIDRPAWEAGSWPRRDTNRAPLWPFHVQQEPGVRRGPERGPCGHVDQCAETSSEQSDQHVHQDG